MQPAAVSGRQAASREGAGGACVWDAVSAQCWPTSLADSWCGLALSHVCQVTCDFTAWVYLCRPLQTSVSHGRKMVKKHLLGDFWVVK